MTDSAPTPADRQPTWLSGLALGVLGVMALAAGYTFVIAAINWNRIGV